MTERSDSVTANDVEPDGRVEGEAKWPPSPKMQIILLVAGVALINCVLIAIFVVAFLLGSG